VIVLGLGYGIAQNLKREVDTQKEEAPLRTQSSNRSTDSTDGDGPELLAEFRKDFLQKKSRYEELKESLQPAADLRAAAISTIEDWENNRSGQDHIESESMMLVRFYHWLRVNPREAMEYLSAPQAGEDSLKSRELLSKLALNVLPDVAREKRVMKSIGWLTSNPVGILPLWKTLISEMKDGGGLALFLRVENELAEISKPWLEIGAEPHGREALRQAGASIQLSEKDSLLDYVKLQGETDRAINLLLGFAGTSDAAATWVLGLVERQELPVMVARRLQGGLGNEALKQNGMDMEKRIAARRFTDGNGKKLRENILGELVANDVRRLLNEGRDWRFEFRHGSASLDDILTSMEGALKIPDEGRDAAQIALYRTLSEENPEKALPLLDSLPEDRRREIMFSNTWQSYGNVNPDDFIAFVKKLPAPETEKEIQDRMKGWEWKVRGSLQRYGDDYIEWVAALPSNPDKYAAINSIIWATRERNPAKAAALNQRFYPKKP